MLGAILDDIIDEQESFQTVTKSLQQPFNSCSDSMTMLSQACNIIEKDEASLARRQEERRQQMEKAELQWSSCAESFLHLYLKMN
jgi:hypothetical protein